MNTLKKKKIDELKDNESRQFFYEEHIETGLPIQIRELRKKRKLTQVKLAEITGFDQSNISDWENPNYEYAPQISTLKRLANAFDVPLIVRFGSWKELLDWESDLTNEKLAPLTFDEEFSDDEEQKDTIDFRKSIASNIVNFPKANLTTSFVSSRQSVQPKLWLDEVKPVSSALAQNKPASNKPIPPNSSNTFEIKLKKIA